MPRAFGFILCGVCVTCVVAPRAGADQVAEYREQIRHQRAQFESSVRAQPLLDQKRIDELFTLRVEGDDLVLTPQLAPTSTYSSMRAELEGFTFPAVVARMRLGRAGASQFELILDDYGDPDAFARLHVLARPGMLQFDKTDQRLDGTRRVRLIQAERQVHLAVFELDRSQNVTLVAETFAALRRQHPHEVDAFVRPLLRELRQEAAFAPDAATAWQVLSDRWPLDASTEARVRAELPALDAADFRHREAAVTRLRAVGRDAALAIRRMDRAGLSAEQNARLDGVAARFEPLRASRAAELRQDPTFLLDCLYADEPNARRLALARLAEIVGRPLAIDVDAPLDVRVPAVDRLRSEFRIGGSTSATPTTAVP